MAVWDRVRRPGAAAPPQQDLHDLRSVEEVVRQNREMEAQLAALKQVHLGGGVERRRSRAVPVDGCGQDPEESGMHGPRDRGVCPQAGCLGGYPGSSSRGGGTTLEFPARGTVGIMAQSERQGINVAGTFFFIVFLSLLKFVTHQIAHRRGRILGNGCPAGAGALHRLRRGPRL